MARRSNYDKFPFVTAGSAEECSAGWEAVSSPLRSHRVICVESYPGVFVDEVAGELYARLGEPAIFSSHECLKTPDELRAMLNPLLGADRVFGRMSGLSLEDYFDASKLDAMRLAIERSGQLGSVLVIGTGASLLVSSWRYSGLCGHGSLGNSAAPAARRNRKSGRRTISTSDLSLKYKRAFFVDWRAADRLKKQLFDRIDYYLDTNDMHRPN